jgi:hypothetical protein
MLAGGKISAEEADALLEVLQEAPPPSAANANAAANLTPGPKFLRVMVDSNEGGRANRVNVRVPLDLIRAGMRLAALLPAVAYEPVNRALKENGLDLDVSKIKPENLEELVAHLRELQVDVDGDGDKVRVFCE